MADKNDDVKAKMLAALEAKKNKKGAPGTQSHSEGGSKIRGGQRSGGFSDNRRDKKDGDFNKRGKKERRRY